MTRWMKSELGIIATVLTVIITLLFCCRLKLYQESQELRAGDVSAFSADSNGFLCCEKLFNGGPGKVYVYVDTANECLTNPVPTGPCTVALGANVTMVTDVKRLGSICSYADCATGPNTPYADTSCRVVDYDADGDVDLLDYAEHQRSSTTSQ